MAKQPETIVKNISDALDAKSQALNLELAATLEGSPKQYPTDHQSDLKFLETNGIAVSTNDGWMRGYKFHQYFN